MTVELIGAGFGRTGTLSLKAALESIGYDPCHHMMEVFENPGSENAWYDACVAKQNGRDYDWAKLVDGYRAFVDWPGCYFWQEFADTYPDAPVLLSVRDPEKWYQSAYETIYQVIQHAHSLDDPEIRQRMKAADSIVFQATFEDRFEDRAFAMGVFEAHNEAVQRAIPAERLLVYQVGDGWEPLCEFLGRPVPDHDFPHVNSRGEFHDRLKERFSADDA
jgi:hypothetical protein